MTTIDKEGVMEAYDEVRDDNNETSWFVMAYDGKNVVVADKGTEYEEFLKHFTDNQRMYGYVRVTSGDELSKRAKFVFVTWCGLEVGALQRAKVGVDKSVVKTAVKNFAIEVMADEISELKYETVMEKARKAGGANYGTGV